MVQSSIIQHDWIAKFNITFEDSYHAFVVNGRPSPMEVRVHGDSPVTLMPERGLIRTAKGFCIRRFDN